MDVFDKDAIRRDRSALEGLLARAGCLRPQALSIKCPFHNDAKPSAQIRKSNNTGFWYFYCFSGCDLNGLDYWALLAHIEGRSAEDVLSEARESQKAPSVRPRAEMSSGLNEASPVRPIFASIDDLIDSYRRRHPRIVIEERNEYVNPDSKATELVTIRYREDPSARKQFAQATPAATGWVNAGIKGDKLPLFNRTRIRAAKRVVLVEGEKCVRAVTALNISDLAATTIPGGAQNSMRGDLGPLAGKAVYVWRDNDDPGMAWEAGVMDCLKALVPQPTIYRIDPAQLELKEKQDVFDYLADADGTREDKVTALELAIMDAECVVGKAGLRRRLERIAAGEIYVFPFPGFPVMSQLTQALMPGTVTCIVGDPGVSKSFLNLETLWRLVESGHDNCAVLMLEESDEFHQHRMLAQMSGQPDVLDFEFIRDNGQWAVDLFDRYHHRVSKVAPFLECANSKQMTLQKVGDWVEQKIRAGAKLIAIDPITAAAAGKDRWNADQDFMMRLKSLIEPNDVAAILFTHPKAGQAGKPSLSGSAGGLAYPRFSQTMLWMRYFEKVQDSKVIQEYGTQTIEHRRVIEIRKARNGRGSGQKVAVDLSPENLCFVEHGLIMGD